MSANAGPMQSGLTVSTACCQIDATFLHQKLNNAVAAIATCIQEPFKQLFRGSVWFQAAVFGEKTFDGIDSAERRSSHQAKRRPATDKKLGGFRLSIGQACTHQRVPVAGNWRSIKSSTVVHQYLKQRFLHASDFGMDARCG